MPGPLEGLLIFTLIVLSIFTSVLAYDYVQQGNTLSESVTLLHNLESQVDNLSRIVDRQGSSTLLNASHFVVGPALQDSGGRQMLLDNATYPFGGYVAISPYGSNYTGQNRFYILTDWKGEGGRVPVIWEIHPNGWEYICGNTPVPCVTPATTMDIPARIVIPVPPGSTLAIWVQNPETTALSVSVSIVYVVPPTPQGNFCCWSSAPP